MTATVLGVSQLLARFARTETLGKVATVAGQAATAREVQDSAQAKVPVDTGALQASIQALPDRVIVGATYAPFVEFGTSNMAAQPYLRPAADEATGREAEAEMERIVSQA